MATGGCKVVSITKQCNICLWDAWEAWEANASDRHPPMSADSSTTKLRQRLPLERMDSIGKGLESV
jgi:hypothetical protein